MPRDVPLVAVANFHRFASDKFVRFSVKTNARIDLDPQLTIGCLQQWEVFGRFGKHGRKGNVVLRVGVGINLDHDAEEAEDAGEGDQRELAEQSSRFHKSVLGGYGFTDAALRL